jgi:hypothetical protein
MAANMLELTEWVHVHATQQAFIGAIMFFVHLCLDGRYGDSFRRGVDGSIHA